MENDNNKLYKQRCIEQWEWMRDSAEANQWKSINDAKADMRRALKTNVDCWACELADEYTPAGMCRCPECPVTWREGRNHCNIKGSPYYDIDCGVLGITAESCQRVIDVVEETWKV